MNVIVQPESREGSGRRASSVRGALRSVFFTTLVLCGCSSPATAPPTRTAPAASGDVSTQQTPPSPSPPTPETLRIPVPDPAEAERWLHVVRVRDGAAGGWATAEFDSARNKLTIQTRGVQVFRIDKDRIGIDWSRPVVLRIDGYNSQLLPRDSATLTFTVTPTGDWTLND
ncbi:MAG: hypothetical protein BroJett003_03290 [Planctomycetota bacterium]|nr:MAG: hypothetical protein BroJett003_03290 [Planctomycetota bacterium]